MATTTNISSLATTTASKSNLLTIPLELRRQVYSHLFIHDSVVNVASDLIERPLQNGVVSSCRQIYYEALDYYYANNTFLLSLPRPPDSMSKLLRHLSPAQHLQVEIGDLVLSPTNRAFFLQVHTQKRCDWFLETLRQAKQGQEGRTLRTLAAIDHCGTSIVSE